MTASASAKPAPTVVFLNPGGIEDIFFKPMTLFMQAAANDLGVKLEVIYCDRDRLLFVKKAKMLLQRTNLPEYILLINEQNLGADVLKQADAKGIKVFLFNEGLSPQDNKKYGAPGEVYKNWIGEFLRDDEQAGYLLGTHLIKEALRRKMRDGNGVLYIAGISGAGRTASTTLRSQGLKRAAATFSKVQIKQIVPGNWDPKRAQFITTGLLQRYENIKVIWCASDGMADGAVKAITALKFIPGQDILTGGVDWADIGIKQVKENKFSATVGGSILDGGISLIIVHDYHNGIPFAQKTLKDNFFLLDKNNMDSHKEVFNTEAWKLIDFKKLSKHTNPQLKEYDFSLKNIFDWTLTHPRNVVPTPLL